MAVTLKADGTINFNDKGDCLLSVEDITREAFDMFKYANERRIQFEQSVKVAELRRSCGVKAEPITIKRPEPYRG
jgi:hypothetical protein